MDALTYTQVRKNFSDVMNKVCDDHSPIIVTRQNREPVVMMSLEDYNALEETLYLMKNPQNAQRLWKAMNDIRDQNIKERTLLED